MTAAANSDECAEGRASDDPLFRLAARNLLEAIAHRVGDLVLQLLSDLWAEHLDSIDLPYGLPRHQSAICQHRVHEQHRRRVRRADRGCSIDFVGRRPLFVAGQLLCAVPLLILAFSQGLDVGTVQVLVTASLLLHHVAGDFAFDLHGRALSNRNARARLRRRQRLATRCFGARPLHGGLILVRGGHQRRVSDVRRLCVGGRPGDTRLCGGNARPRAGGIVAVGQQIAINQMRRARPCAGRSRAYIAPIADPRSRL